MTLTAYQDKLERMVPDQKIILVGAAYGDRRVWESLAELYRFEETDQTALRSYIRNSYRPDGTPIPEPAGSESVETPETSSRD